MASTKSVAAAFALLVLGAGGLLWYTLRDASGPGGGPPPAPVSGTDAPASGAAHEGAAVGSPAQPRPRAGGAWRPKGEGRVVGTVRDDRGEKPVADVPLTLTAGADGPDRRLSARSGADGSFVFDAVPAFGAWTLSAPIPAGGRVEQSGVSVRADETTDVGVIRLALPVSVSGIVVDEDGLPVAGAAVRVLRPFDFKADLFAVIRSGGTTIPELSTVAAGVSGEDGRFALKQVPLGSFDLAVDARRQQRVFARSIRRIDLHAGKDAPDLRIVVADGFEVAGHVRRTGGGPVAGTRVVLSQEPDNPLEVATAFARALHVTTGADGSFVASNLAAGDWSAALEAEGRIAPAKRTFTLPGFDGPLDFELGGDAELTGLVTGADGKTVAGATVVVAVGEARGRTTSGEDGVYRLLGLASGATANVSATAPGHAPFGSASPFELPGLFGGAAKPAGVEVVPGENRFDIAFPEGGVLRGRVIARGTQDGIAAARVKVAATAMFGGGAASEALTDAKGAFEVRGLAAGRARILIEKSGWYAEGDEKAGALGALFAEAMGGEKDAPKEDPGTGLDIVAAPGRVIERTLELDRGVIVPVRVTGPGGKPAEGATVELVAAKSGLAALDAEELIGGMLGGARGAAGLVTAKDGTAVAETAPARDFRVRVKSPGLVGAESDKLRGDPGQTLPSVELVLRAGGTVEGRVTEPGGKGVEGVEIRWMSPEGGGGNPLAAMFGGEIDTGGEPHAKSDAEGRFRMTGVQPGKVILRAKVDDFRPYTKTGVEVTDEGTTTHDFQLDPGAAIEGIVVDDRGAQVRGAELTFTGKSSRFGGLGGGDIKAKSDAAGAFRVSGLPPGVIRVNAEAKGLLQAKTLEVTPGGGPVRVELLTPHRVAVLVLCDGKPVDGARVTVTPADKAGAAPTGASTAGMDFDFSALRRRGDTEVFSGGDGRAVAEGLLPGTYRVTVSRADAGFDPVASNIATRVLAEVASNGPDVRVDCAVGHRLVVRVTGGDGQPIPATVQAARVPEGPPVPAAETRNGAAEIPGLEPGDYRLTVTAEGHASASVTVRSDAGETTVRMTQAGTLKGRVLGATGKPIGFAQLTATMDGNVVKTDSFFDRGGRFTLDQLPPGAGTLTVTGAARGRRLKAEVAWSVGPGQTTDLGDIPLSDVGPANEQK